MAISAVAAVGVVAAGVSAYKGYQQTKKLSREAEASARKRHEEAMALVDEQEATAPPMPTANDENVQRARKRSLLRRRSRGGRDSTILSESDRSPLGG